MPSALTVRFRPSGLWRLGPDNGARTRTDRVFHSDSLFSALTQAMRDLGWVDEWIAATAQSQSPAVRLSSCFPFTSNGLLIQPPRTIWPPVQPGKVRWKAARFVPLSVVSALLRDEDLKEEQWAVDPVSECLAPVTRNGAAPAPFRVVTRATAAVDRVSGASESADAVACLQFAPGAGMWFVAVFADEASRETWEPRIRSSSILLADSGVGGGRSRGWGRSRRPHFERGEWPGLLGVGGADQGGETAWWMVSLFSPGEGEQVDWNRGNYRIVVRAGRVESHAAWGDLKPASRLVAEGSVLLSGAPPNGTARNVSPAELPHPVYRSGIALAVPIPWREAQRFSLLEALPAREREGVAAGTEPVAEAPVTEAEPIVESDMTPEALNAEPMPKAPVAEAVPVAEAEVVPDVEPMSEAPTAEAVLVAEAEPVAEAEIVSDVEPVAEAPAAEAVPVAEAEPVVEAEVVPDEEPVTEAPVAETPTEPEPKSETEAHPMEPETEEPPRNPEPPGPPVEEPPTPEEPPMQEPPAQPDEEEPRG